MTKTLTNVYLAETTDRREPVVINGIRYVAADDQQPPTLRDHVAKAWCADYYGESSPSAQDPHIDHLDAADAALRVVADWLAAQPMPYPDVVARGQRDHDVRLLRGESS